MIDAVLTNSFSFRHYPEAYIFMGENREEVTRVMIYLDGAEEASQS
ncbi:MAG: hypothetical protein WAO35_26800 [Terriglobia bacterium]